MRRLALLFIVFCASANAEDRLVSVLGQAELSVPADTISIDFNVSRTHPSDASIAKQQVDQIASAAVKALRDLGVSDKDISSSTLSVTVAERYDHNDNAIPAGRKVERQVKLVLRDIGLYNKAINALVASGVSEITDITPKVSSEEEQKKVALAKAVADGRDRAEFLAHELGAKVVRVHQIGSPFAKVHNGALEEIVVTARRREDAPNIYEFQPGDVSISSSIELEFEIE